jgi:hypothetical protein
VTAMHVCPHATRSCAESGLAWPARSDLRMRTMAADLRMRTKQQPSEGHFEAHHKRLHHGQGQVRAMVALGLSRSVWESIGALQRGMDVSKSNSWEAHGH